MLILDKEAKHAIRGKILRNLLEMREASFRDLLVRIPVTTLDFHLRVLRREQIVEATERGYRVSPEKVQYLRNKFNIKAEHILFTGVDSEGDINVVEKAAGKAGIKPTKVLYVVNMNKAEKLRDVVEKRGGVLVTVDSDNFEKAFELLERIVEDEIYNVEPVIDLSTAPRSTTILLMKLGEKYGLRRFLMKDERIVWV
ncbi:MAG: helix-turn-helix domain-containing protein [Candidatus Jordarchaeales archaeon]